MPKMKMIIGTLMILVYSLILVHNFIPHHTHSNIEYVHIHSSDEIHSHSDCDHEHECEFPFHQHNINEAGLFRSSTSLVVSIPFEFESKLQKLHLILDDPSIVDQSYAQIQILDYGEPEITSASLRGPPIA